YSNSCVIETATLSPDTLTRLAGSACRCAYKRNATLGAKQASFPEGIKFSEDRIFNIIAMSGAKKISYLKKAYYNRLIREGSACFRYYPDMTEQIAAMRKRLIAAVEQNWGKAYILDYEKQIAGHIRHAVSNFTSRSAKSPLRKLRELCNDSNIRDCLEASGNSDIRTRLILNRQAFCLLVVGKITNIYHHIWK
ncbi:MAG: hypothetical protein K2F64_03430, partial [Muribaculaceae bacterium]|nr:hypothetical protein [Muribaculaceae bacterium]